MVMKFDRQGSRLTVKMMGELDHHNAAKVKAELDAQLADAAVKRLILDFDDMTLMDSSGIGVIIGRYKIMEKRGGCVEVMNPCRSIDRIMAMSGLYKIVKKIV